LAHDAPFQQTLFVQTASSFDATLSKVERIWLDETAWVDVLSGWVGGADAVFDELLQKQRWGQRTRWMFDHRVVEPRLTARWELASDLPLEPPILESLRQALSAHYKVAFDSAGFNLYRDGGDSVAWHRDKIRREIREPIVPLVSLGEQRNLLFRPFGGGRSRAFPLGHGDLLVTGGQTQRTWEHAVPKVSRAGARISIAFRHGLDKRAYGDASLRGRELPLEGDIPAPFGNSPSHDEKYSSVASILSNDAKGRRFLPRR
jgi:alkylated DNA repair dioxygenase AlkB